MTEHSILKRLKFTEILSHVFYIFLIIFISACADSDHSSPSSETGTAYFSVKWHDAPTTQHYERAAILDCEAAGVERITCEVYDRSNFYLTAGGPWECSVGTGTITNIHPGTSRKFIVLGKDINENVMHHGEIANIIITAGDTTNVGIIDVYSFVPTLSSPEDGSSVTSNAFSLQWTVTQGAEEYRIVVSEDSGFSTTIIDETITSTTYTPVGLSTSTTYYWKVYARDIHSNISADSEIWSFSTTAAINEIPTATITSPSDSSTFTAGDTITFNGTGNDVEDGALTGASLVWTSNIDSQIGTDTSFATSSLSVGTHTITLTALDSNSATGTDSINIIINPIGNTLPTATISAPTDGSTYNEGSNITFSGSGNDAEDGTLTGSSLVWTSSINEQIGTGTSFSKDDLSIGTHTITLTALDSNSATGTDSINIIINPIGNTLPTATISAPTDGSIFNVGDTITFSGSGSDAEDGTLGGASLDWISSISGNIGTGASFTTSSLSAGTHTITLTVTDNDNATDSTDISISIMLPGDYINNLNMTFNLIPAGTFTMGSPSYELGRGPDETQHQVTLTQPFYMQTTEVTQAQWIAVMGSNPSYFSSCSDCPVEQVSWDDVQTFISTLNVMEEGTYRLPTEAEWEYAARAGSTTALANGNITVEYCEYDANLTAMGWYCYNSSSTNIVAQKNPNAWGLYDMHGNVYEWCQDWYGAYSSGSVTDPTGPSSGSDRVRRGGSWDFYAWSCRSADRRAKSPDVGDLTLGFRLVFMSPNAFPTASITSPTDGSTFNEGDNITFNGTGSDPEDGALTDAFLVWTSSIDDQIGTGTSFTTSSLSVGAHTITLTATDSNSATGTDSVSITVNATYSWTMLNLPDTGQTMSYTDTWGEDSDYNINPPSYADNGDGTITDYVTSLMWQKQDDDLGYTWDNAISYCESLELAGYTDWRLPSKKELLSIVDYGTYNPSIDITYFPGTNALKYWSSTTDATFPSIAWGVSFNDGWITSEIKSDNYYYVRCILGGQ